MLATPPRLLLIEDEITLSLLLRDRLEVEGYEVAVSKDGEQGLTLTLSESFSLVILDIKLPGKDGFDVCRELRRHGVLVPVLMLTARSDVADRVKGLKLGADDYLSKPFEVEELLARIEALLRRTGNSPWQAAERVFSFGNIVVDLQSQEVLRAGVPIEMTAKEFALLRYFIANPNQPLARQVLLEQVWGYKHVLNTRTVDLHVCQLRQKLEADPKEPRHVVTAFRSGYRFIPFPSDQRVHGEF
jgi:two-component system alkaline phosphatase synthesis response regulator PhoP